VYGDASKTPFKDGFFDVIFNRRGPSYYAEYFRLLRPGGYYIEIGIGEKDAASLKKAFGRGQNFGQWDKSTLVEEQEEMASVGLQAVFGQDYLYNEFYKDSDNFELFLQGVPIFEDFNLNKDRVFLNAYYQTSLGENGKVKLERHRIVIIARKS